MVADDDIRNLDHILGSVAEVERVWSWARYVLTTQRAMMAPVLFEAIMFLNFNRDLWDEKTVQLVYDLFTKDKHDEYAKENVRKAAKEAADIADDADEDMEYSTMKRQREPLVCVRYVVVVQKYCKSSINYYRLQF